MNPAATTYRKPAMKRHSCLLLALAWTPAAPGAAVPPATYRIETVAGSANMGDGGPATAAQISTIQGIAIDRWGTLPPPTPPNPRGGKTPAGGVLPPRAGPGAPGFRGEGGPATSAQ